MIFLRIIEREGKRDDSLNAIINLRVVRFLLSPWKKNTASALHARRRRRLYHEVKRGDDDDAIKRENSSRRKRRREDRAATENGRRLRRKPTTNHLLMMEPSKTYENPSNYCLAYLMMLLCRWCRAALIFFFVLCDLVVFFRAIKDDVDALGVLWLPRAFMPCNATACVERTFILVVCASFLCRTAEKSSLRRNFLTLVLFLRGSEKVFVFGFFIRAVWKRMAPEKKRHEKLQKKQSISSLSRSSFIFYETLAHIHREIYNHVSRLRAIYNTQS